MHKHLVLLNNAMSAYFSANQSSLDAISKQLSESLKQIKLSDNGSWLEHNDDK